MAKDMSINAVFSRSANTQSITKWEAENGTLFDFERQARASNILEQALYEHTQGLITITEYQAFLNNFVKAFIGQRS